MNQVGRQQDIYNQLRSMQTPEEERQRLALEERLQAQGRGGIQTAQYGGTPEQLAMAKAQAEAQNQAGMMAMQQAGSEQDRAYQQALGLAGQASQFAGTVFRPPECRTTTWCSTGSVGYVYRTDTVTVGYRGLRKDYSYCWYGCRLTRAG
jgi:hypothetical protein